MKKLLLMMGTLLIAGLAALPAAASEAAGAGVADLTETPYGLIGLLLFIAAYALVIFEEKLHLRKSKPVIFAAGVI